MMFGELDAHARVVQPGEELSSGKAKVEQIFKGRAQQIDVHRIIMSFGTKPVHERDPNTTGVNFGFIFDLRMPSRTLTALKGGKGRCGPSSDHLRPCAGVGCVLGSRALRTCARPGPPF
jgi:hypothetical protein